MRYPPLPELRPALSPSVPSPTRAARRPSNRSWPTRPSATATRRDEVYTKALRVISERFSGTDLTVIDVAQEIQISRRGLQQIFAERGKSFREELRSARMARAAELVLRTPGPTEVAHKVGYRYENHLARAFEEQIGVSPSVLRRALTARDRYEHRRAESPPESARSLRVFHSRMSQDAALVHQVHRQLADAAQAA